MDITFTSNQGLLGNSRNKPVSILIIFPGVRHRVINVTEGVHAHYVVVCWKEKGSYCGAEMALFWSVLRFGWHELGTEVLLTSGVSNIFFLHFYFDRKSLSNITFA